MFKKLKKSIFGFTLMEMLIVVAILAILGGIAAAVVPGIKDRYMQKELDSKAEVIYTAVQNRLTELRASANEDKYQKTGGGISKCDYTASDFTDLPDPDPDGLHNEFSDLMYYTLSRDDEAALSISERLNSSLQNGEWIVEYNNNSGTVYAVFYSDDNALSGADWKPDALNDLRSKEDQGPEARIEYAKENGAHVGYYGGSETAMIRKAKALTKPIVEIENGEELIVRLYLSNANDVEKAKESTEENTIIYCFDLVEYDPDGKEIVRYKYTDEDPDEEDEEDEEDGSDVKVIYKPPKTVLRSKELTDTEDGYAELELVLDSLSTDSLDNATGHKQYIEASTGHRFNDMFGKETQGEDAALTPGYNLKIENLSAKCGAAWSTKETGESGKFNSLFGDPQLRLDTGKIKEVKPEEKEKKETPRFALLTADPSPSDSKNIVSLTGTTFRKDDKDNTKYIGTAAILTGRHLQNLDADSGVSDEFKNAFLACDIDLKNEEDPLPIAQLKSAGAGEKEESRSWLKVYEGKVSFEPIDNKNLTGTFDGDGDLTGSDYVTKLKSKYPDLGKDGEPLFTIYDADFENENDDPAALFENSYFTEIKDLRMVRPKVGSEDEPYSGDAAALLGTNKKQLTLDNIVIDGAAVYASGENAGVVSVCVQQNNTLTVNNLKVTEPDIGGGFKNAGVLTGKVDNANLIVEKKPDEEEKYSLLITSPVIYNDTATGDVNAGGVVGFVTGSPNSHLLLTNVKVNYHDVRDEETNEIKRASLIDITGATGAACAGGILGNADKSGNDLQFTYVAVTNPAVYASQNEYSAAGGFIGKLSGGANLTNCWTALDENLGGQVGALKRSANGYNVGGFVGKVDTDSTLTLLTSEDCTEGGTFAALNLGNALTPGDPQSLNVGGFVGNNYGTVKAASCYSDCYYEGTGYVGGFVGLSQGGSTVDFKSCYSAGIISEAQGKQCGLYYADENGTVRASVNDCYTILYPDADHIANFKPTVNTAPTVWTNLYYAFGYNGIGKGMFSSEGLEPEQDEQEAQGEQEPQEETLSSRETVIPRLLTAAKAEDEILEGGYTLGTVPVRPELGALVGWYLSYDANGGKNAPNREWKLTGSITVSSTKPTRDGYSFLGWSTDKNATTAQYQAGNTIKSSSDVTLYAVWKPNTYTVSFNANGGSGAPGAQIKTHDTALTLSSTKPSRTAMYFPAGRRTFTA